MQVSSLALFNRIQHSIPMKGRDNKENTGLQQKNAYYEDDCADYADCLAALRKAEVDQASAEEIKSENPCKKSDEAAKSIIEMASLLTITEEQADAIVEQVYKFIDNPKSIKPWYSHECSWEKRHIYELGPKTVLEDYHYIPQSSKEKEIHKVTIDNTTDNSKSGDYAKYEIVIDLSTEGKSYNYVKTRKSSHHKREHGNGYEAAVRNEIVYNSNLKS